MSHNLEEYLREANSRGVIDHSIRAQVGGDGKVTFYIHPSTVSGDTLDFKVEGNALAPAGWAITNGQ